MCPHAEWRSTPCFLSGPDVTTRRTAGELQGVRQGRPPASAWKAQQLLNISINHLKGPPPSGPGLDVGLELQACAFPCTLGLQACTSPCTLGLQACTSPCTRVTGVHHADFRISAGPREMGLNVLHTMFEFTGGLRMASSLSFWPRHMAAPSKVGPG